MSTPLESLRSRLDDIRDERHFPAHMLSAHDEMLEVLDAMAMAFEVLSFIDGYSRMPSELWRERWPDWWKQVKVARDRYAKESANGARRSKDPMVNNERDAADQWVFRPLIRAALERVDPA